MIVVDVNIVAYLLIAGEKTAEAQSLWEKDSYWIVPDLWRHEFLNVLATFVRHGGTGLDTARRLWDSALDFLWANETSVDPALTLELAERYKLSAYDAQYLALAVTKETLLITEDKALIASVPQQCLSMREFLQRPESPSLPK